MQHFLPSQTVSFNCKGILYAGIWLMLVCGMNLPVIQSQNAQRCYTESFEISGKANPIYTPDRQRDISSRSAHTLRTYKIAISATGEYTFYHGGATGALIAIQQTLANVNKVYERDLSIRFQLIPNNNQLIFTNPITDPFSNGQIAQMAAENQQLLDHVIGDAHYDLGIVFGTSGGGLAFPAAMGESGKKGNAACGITSPEGIAFDLDFVAHEIGHQFGAHHTHNNPCSRHTGTAFEPGSGSTIMSYAGICPPNLQSHVDPYFHAVSIDEIREFVTFGPASHVGNLATTGNSTPQLLIDPGPFTVPRLTPFLLDGQATDADGDSLTWCWEQFDLGISGTLDQPIGNAPIFRSYPPESESERSFPKLSNLIFSLKAVGETYPDYSRKMHFRATVRDNRPGGGATTTGLTSVTVWDKAGPFRILNPNDTENWMSGSLQQIKWDVAKTDLPPINCKSVDIYLSTDGGRSFPIILAEDIPNTGSAVVSMPRIFATKCRIRIKAHEGIFFDISDHNFQLKPSSSPTYTMLPFPLLQKVCQSDTARLDIVVDSIQGFNLPVGFTISGLPDGVSATFSKNPVLGADTIQLDIFPMEGFSVGSHKLRLDAYAHNSPNISQEFELITYPASGGEIQPLKPAAGATAVDTKPLFQWQANNTAQVFSLDISTHPGFPQNVTTTFSNLHEDSFWLPSHLTAKYYLLLASERRNSLQKRTCIRNLCLSYFLARMSYL